MNVYCLNNISKVALATLKENDKVVLDEALADSILVRSFDMHDYDLPKNVLAVARAGAGVNNIPLDKYAKEGVVVFNTPGANANAVKELVLAGLLLASRDIIGGANWVKENSNDINISKAAEKIKSKFSGSEIYGKTISVIGLGVIGVLVANACSDLGMNVKGYDPYLSINNAMKLNKNVKYCETIEDAVMNASFITIHVPALDSTKKMINKSIFDIANDNLVVLNFSRDCLIDEDDLKAAIASGKIRKYVTDFANENVCSFSNTIIFPHLGASTIEAEDNCALMAINELKDYLENGNITNSVNFPSLNAGVKNGIRLCIFHKNIPGQIAKFSTVISDNKVNITNLVNKSKGEFAYTVLDIDDKINEDDIKNIDGVIRVRVI